MTIARTTAYTYLPDDYYFATHATRAQCIAPLPGRLFGTTPPRYASGLAIKAYLCASETSEDAYLLT